MTDILLEQVGPNGNIQAIVEADHQVVFFYLFGSPDIEFPMKSVWVRNLVPAPHDVDVEGMKSGSPPCNPARHCRHPQGAPAPNAEDLRVVWLPEGNGAALYEREEILAILPPWSGMESFNGYARDNIGQGTLAWELRPDNAMIARFEEAQIYWQRWDDESLWPSLQSALMEKIEGALGRHSNYYAIDGGYWPPKALVRIPVDQGVALVTVGVSARPQPNVEFNTDEPQSLRRVELGAILPSGWSDETIKRFGAYLSGQSNYPWTNYSWLGPGHTIPCDSWHNPAFEYALLVREFADIGALPLGTQFGDPVHVLWFLPITAEERETAMATDSDQLARTLPPQRWQSA